MSETNPWRAIQGPAPPVRARWERPTGEWIEIQGLSEEEYRVADFKGFHATTHTLLDAVAIAADRKATIDPRSAETAARPANVKIEAKIDYYETAQALSRADFLLACPFHFLVGTDSLDKPPGVHKTGVFAIPAELNPAAAAAAATAEPKRAKVETFRPRVLAIRKITDVFPEMCTVGRTSNNDIAVADVSISRFHAFFKLTDKTVELADAGARNGTWAGEQRLIKGQPPVPLAVKDVVRFGQIEFQLLDAQSCWEWVQRRLGRRTTRAPMTMKEDDEF